MKAVLFISHGSRSRSLKSEVPMFVARLKAQSGIRIFEYAFLEITSPDIPRGIQRCVEKGADHIVVLLNFLNSGKHVSEDIPRLVREAGRKYPHVRFEITPPVGQHPRILEVFLSMLRPDPA